MDTTEPAPASAGPGATTPAQPPAQPPTAAPAAAPAPRVTRDAVLDAAMRLVRDQGAEGLSMRKVAAELGVAVTSIYWHVGNRDALVDQLVDRVITDMGSIEVTGDTPAERIISIARAGRRMILERPHLVGLVRERGLDALMMLPSRRALVRETAAAGLHGEAAAMAVQAVQSTVAGFVMLERALTCEARMPEAVRAWHDEVARGDPDLARAITRTDPEAVFDLVLRALVAELVG